MLSMKRLALWLLAGTLLPGVAVAQYDGTYFQVGTPPSVVVQLEALMLDRFSDPDGIPVVLNGNTSQVLLGTNDLDFDGTQTGLRLSALLPDGCGAAWEGVYFGLNYWQDAAAVTGQNNLRIPGDLGLRTLDYLDADRMELRWTSMLNNAEINRVQSYGDLAILGGIRYLNLDENFNINSTDADSGASDYHIHAQNHLIGGQAGVRVARTLWCFNWDFTAKAGLYGNAAEQRTVIRDFDNSVILRDAEGSRGHFAFIGDLNWSLVYQFTPHFAGRAGYNVMWVEGLALAPDQLDFSDTAASSTGIDVHGGMFLHGLNVGLEACW